MSDTVLMGIGNLLLCDEGVGVHVAHAMRERYGFDPEVEIVDGGTRGLELLTYFEDHERMLLVDAVDFGREPGHVEVLDGDDLPDAILHKFSVHHIGLNDLMGVARLTGKLPREIRLIGVQPASLEPSLELSETVKGRFEEIVALALRQLEAWGIAHRPKEVPA